MHIISIRDVQTGEAEHHLSFRSSVLDVTRDVLLSHLELSEHIEAVCCLYRSQQAPLVFVKTETSGLLKILPPGSIPQVMPSPTQKCPLLLVTLSHPSTRHAAQHTLTCASWYSVRIWRGFHIGPAGAQVNVSFVQTM